MLTDPAAEHALPGSDLDYAAMIHDTKRAVADGILGSEVRRVVRELPALAGAPTSVLVDAVAELVACFPVYRSYVPEGLEHLDAALADAPARRPDLAEAFDAPRPGAADADRAGRAALRADQRRGDGQGRGGLRVLPLQPAHLAQRGRRRPEPLLGGRRRVPRRHGRTDSRTGRTR